MNADVEALLGGDCGLKAPMPGKVPMNVKGRPNTVSHGQTPRRDGSHENGTQPPRAPRDGVVKSVFSTVREQVAEG